MRSIRVLLGILVVTSPATGCGGHRVISAHGVRVQVPSGWQRVKSAPAGPVTDPRTLLVVGTAGVRPKRSQCQIAAYRIPAAGAVVVVVGWKSVASAGGVPKPGLAPLEELTAVRRPSLECFSGRGAAA